MCLQKPWLGRRGAGGGDGGEDDEDDGAALLVADDLNNPRVQAKRAKIDHLWALLNGGRPALAADGDEEAGEAGPSDDAPAQPPAGGSKPAVGPSSSVSLAALCRTVDAKKRKKTNTDLVSASCTAVA